MQVELDVEVEFEAGLVELADRLGDSEPDRLGDVVDEVRLDVERGDWDWDWEETAAAAATDAKLTFSRTLKVAAVAAAAAAAATAATLLAEDNMDESKELVPASGWCGWCR